MSEGAALGAVEGPGLKGCEEKLRLGTVARSESLSRPLGEAGSEGVAQIQQETPALGDASTHGMATETAAALRGAGLSLGDKPCVLLVAGPRGGASHQALWRPEDPVWPNTEFFILLNFDFALIGFCLYPIFSLLE